MGHSAHLSQTGPTVLLKKIFLKNLINLFIPANSLNSYYDPTLSQMGVWFPRNIGMPNM